LSTRRPIVVVGSINIDLVSVAEKIPAAGETLIGTAFQIHPGGKGANQAVAVARLGYPVRMIGRLGNDNFGSQLRANMQAVGVDCTAVAISEEPTGVATILVSSSGENCIVVTPGANARVSPADLEANLPIIRDAGIVLAQLEIPMETVECLAALCKREGVQLILDPAPARDLPSEIFPHLAWITPNESEALFYARRSGTNCDATPPKEIALELLASGCRGVLLKLGSRGAFLATDQCAAMIPAIPVTPIDSTAAGDAFNGAFATGLMLGKSPRESAKFAAAVAAISVTRRGAQPSMPTMAEVERFNDNRFVSP
jgi:ribokinase